MDPRRKPRHRWQRDFTGRRHADDECRDCTAQRRDLREGPLLCWKREGA